MSAEKINTTAAHWSTSRTFEIEFGEKVKYYDRRLADFRSQELGNQGWNYYNNKYRDKSSKRYGDWRQKND